MRGIGAGPTDDVVVTVAGATYQPLLELHRFDAAGNVVSVHQDTTLGYPYISNPVIDANNDVGAAFVSPFTLLRLRKIAPSGATLNDDVIPISPPYAEQVYLDGAGADAAGNLYVDITVDAAPMHEFPFTEGGHRLRLPPAGPMTEVLRPFGSYPLPGSPLPVGADGHTYSVVSLAAGTTGCPGVPLTVPAGGALRIGESDTTGACVWAKLLAVPNTTTEWMDFTVGADGSLALARWFTGTIDLGSGPLTSGASGAMAFARFDAAGNLLWARSFDGLTSGFARVNATGMMAIKADYSGAVDLGAGPLPASANTVLAAFDAAGNLRWNKAVTVDKGYIEIAMSPCALYFSTNSTTVDLGSGPLSVMMGTSSTGPAMNSIGIAALAL
ncbi:MAG: hypothetical protein QM820_19410 [Minicystis sp.]